MPQNEYMSRPRIELAPRAGAIGAAVALHVVLLGALACFVRPPSLSVPASVEVAARLEPAPDPDAAADVLPYDIERLAPPPSPVVDPAPPSIEFAEVAPDPDPPFLPEIESLDTEVPTEMLPAVELPRSVALWTLGEEARRRLALEQAAREAVATPPPPVRTPSPATPPAARTGATELLLLQRPDPRLYYPHAARVRGIQGDVLVRIYVDSSGRVVEASVVAGSGSPLLDDAALRVARATVFAPGSGGAAELPVAFRLR